ncbi:antitoxin PaaA2 family protein [Verminephrobacter aporrectodeae]|uniref:antitoxin PaaA2 family protein n=1 Tax=Verminephrobacter aporrectodeae TaxID=1110389 RepID=UPI00224381B1|nr:hypothetical protein [Verminephrobacter aporrectodeae]
MDRPETTCPPASTTSGYCACWFPHETTRSLSYLKGLGISRYNVNAADFDPQALKTSRVRPDASERMRSAFEAKAHTDWVREKVAESLADPRPNIPHRHVMDEVQALIDSKRKQHASKAAS